MRSQPVEVAHRVDGLVRRQVVGVGRAPAGLLAGMDLDQLAPVEDPHQRPVGAHLDACADQVARAPSRAPWRPRCDDRDAPSRSRRSARRRRSVGAGSSRGCSSTANTSAGSGLGGAVHPQPGPLPAPRLGPALRVGEIDERLAGEERAGARTAPSAPPAACPAGDAPGPGRSRTRGPGRTRRTPGSTAARAGRRRRRSPSGCRGSPCANTPPKNAHAASHPAITVLGRLAEASATRSSAG